MNEKGSILIWVLIGTVIIWIGITYGLSFFVKNEIFEAVNSLFSALAFAGLIYAVIMQKTELQLQRQELELQRNELEQTRKELERSASAQERSEVQQARQSENLKKTATLNALGTLVEYYAEVEKKTYRVDGSKHHESIQLQEEYIQKIKGILEHKKNV